MGRHSEQLRHDLELSTLMGLQADSGFQESVVALDQGNLGAVELAAKFATVAKRYNALPDIMQVAIQFAQLTQDEIAG